LSKRDCDACWNFFFSGVIVSFDETAFVSLISFIFFPSSSQNIHLISEWFVVCAAQSRFKLVMQSCLEIPSSNLS
jgi:hypothetical protein